MVDSLKGQAETLRDEIKRYGRGRTR